MKTIAVIAAVLVGALLFAPQASACSCAEPSQLSIHRADAGVIARLVEVVDLGDDTARFEYRVRRVFKGPKSLHRGSRFTIRSSTSGASCGLPQQRTRYGLLLHRDPTTHHWNASLCSAVTPMQMRRIAHRGRRGAPTLPQRGESSRRMIFLDRGLVAALRHSAVRASAREVVDGCRGDSSCRSSRCR
jgi:hypothetical protein